MKYFSEKLNKAFDDVESLEKAEQEAEAKEIEVKKELEQKSNKKKELAKKVEEAEAELNAAYEGLEEIKRSCAKILDESNKQVNDLLEDGYRIVKKAEEKKCEAINNYNEECGTSDIKYYTGRKAVEEFNKAMKNFDTFFSRMLRW